MTVNKSVSPNRESSPATATKDTDSTKTRRPAHVSHFLQSHQDVTALSSPGIIFCSICAFEMRSNNDDVTLTCVLD